MGPPLHKLTVLRRIALSALLLTFAFGLEAQNTSSAIRILDVQSTGGTSGQIAAIRVRNNAQQTFHTAEQRFYIPSKGKYQAYVARIPEGQALPPGISTIPLEGYCTDVHKKPIPEKRDFPPPAGWLLLAEAKPPHPHPAPTLPSEGITILMTNTDSIRFSDEEIEDYFQRAFPTPSGEDSTNPKLIPMLPLSGWPPIHIVLDKEKTDAEITGYILIHAWLRIEEATEKIQANPDYSTPFSADSLRERETIIQHALWMFSSRLDSTEAAYTRADFARNVHRQFIEQTGHEPNEEEKQQLQTGIDQFWNAFSATGEEAKVLVKPDMNDEAPTSVPEEPCPCESCEVLRPIRLFNARTGRLLTGDTIPTYNDRIRLEPPEVRSDCPESCPASNQVVVEKEIRYRSGRIYQNHTSVPVEFGISGPGELILNAQYECRCDGKACRQGTLRRTIRLTESNNCCEYIRRRNNGQLRFGFDHGSVTIERNQLTINVPPAPPETFRLSFNLEAIFCNLNDDQIFAVLEEITNQQFSDSGVRESISFSDISLHGPVNSADSRPHYSLLFSKRVNGRELMVNIILDETACVFDVQLLYNGGLYEHVGPPYLSPAQLEQMAENMGRGTDPKFWYRAIVLISQFARARQYGRQQQYNRAMETFLDFLHNGTSRLLDEVSDEALRAQIEELLLFIVLRAKTHGGWDQLDELLEKMIPVVTAMGGKVL